MLYLPHQDNAKLESTLSIALQNKDQTQKTQLWGATLIIQQK